MRRRWIADTSSPPIRPPHPRRPHRRAGRSSRPRPPRPIRPGLRHCRQRLPPPRSRSPKCPTPKSLFTLHEELETDRPCPSTCCSPSSSSTTSSGPSKKPPSRRRPHYTHPRPPTEKRLALAAPKRAERWRRIALESSKQSRRTDIPEIADPTPLPAALTHETAPLRILLSETEQSLTLATILNQQPATGNRQLTLAIGPEGGWTPEEMSLFTTHAWTPVTLGPRILRAETAAIAAIAIASAHM